MKVADCPWDCPRETSLLSNARSGQSLLLSEHSQKRLPGVESVPLIQLPSGGLPLTGLEEGAGGLGWAFTMLPGASLTAPFQLPSD